MSQRDHLDPRTLYELLDGRLDASDERLAELHLLRCEACRARREECEATVAALAWYAAEPPAPPEGYWDTFWERWPLAGRVERARRAGGWSAAAIGVAAVTAALFVGGVWSARDGVEGEGRAPVLATATAPTEASPAPPGWEGDYELYERFTVAVGGVDPLSKGVVLVSLAAER